ncbi:MAG: aminotransferase class I/II-fold pyridoxal phosphate-dependent enzyme [Patescibacteria group bacterium]
MPPKISQHFKSRQPSSIRMAQFEYAKRHDGVKAINLAIGNISLPMHPAMKEKMLMLQATQLENGVVKYSPTAGFENAQKTFLHLITSSGFDSVGLYCQVTDGGSQAMEMAILGVCGPAGSDESPLMLIEPAYTNYRQFAQRLGRKVVSVNRELNDKGEFELPDLKKIEKLIQKYKPGALVIIPFDNPTGQLYTSEMMLNLAKLCVEYDMWIISDEAYRNFYYQGKNVSIWGIDNEQLADIEGRRISIETSSKAFNACGLRVGALVTDNAEFYHKSVAEYTANLSPNTIGQIIFSTLLDQNKDDLEKWYQQQRTYYQEMMDEVYVGLKRLEPKLIVSQPQAALYSVIDVRKMVSKNFSADAFVLWAAYEGWAEIENKKLTLLLAPMSGFYSVENAESGRTQFRLAYVESLDKMKLVPQLFVKLLEKYLITYDK